jgi:hypothetical protein
MKMTEGWKRFDPIECLTVGERDAISEIIYDNLIDAGYSPSDINWDLTVEFYDDPEDE